MWASDNFMNAWNKKGRHLSFFYKQFYIAKDLSTFARDVIRIQFKTRRAFADVGSNAIVAHMFTIMAALAFVYI